MGYLGPEGSYSYEAALLYSPGSEPVSMKSFSHIIEGVEKGIIEKGILPMENSTEGSVTFVMDGLLHIKETSIINEIVVPIAHNLFSMDGTLEKVHFVLSHSQAIQQCRDFFKTNYPYINLLACESSAVACRIAKEKGCEYGAIASRKAGEIYGLKLIASDIQDNRLNQTRFIILGKNKPGPTGHDKTSIVFSFHKDRPGNLYSVLKSFAEAEVNLTRIESRPAKAEIGKYIFYIDFMGHQREYKISKVLDEIKNITNPFKVLGSYPVHR